MQCTAGNSPSSVCGHTAPVCCLFQAHASLISSPDPYDYRGDVRLHLCDRNGDSWDNCVGIADVHIEWFDGGDLCC